MEGLLQLSKIPLDLLFRLQRGVHAFVPWDEVYPVRNRRPSGCTLVLFERNGLIRQFVRGECPEEPRDGEEEYTFGHDDAWANATTTREENRRQPRCRVCEPCKERGRTRHQMTNGRVPARSTGVRTPQS